MTTQNLDTKDCINPTDVAHELTESVMPAKANFRKSKTFVLAIAAGALIAFGAQVSLTVMTGTEQGNCKTCRSNDFRYRFNDGCSNRCRIIYR